MKSNVIVIGLGPHAKLVQYRFLNSWKQSGNSVHVRLLVDLQDSASSVKQYLSTMSLQPDQLFFLPESDRNAPTIDPQLLELLNRIKPTIDGVIICTEPKAHKKYILWALENNIDVLVDKPLTAPILCETGSYQIWQDYLDIEQALSRSTARLSLMTNKRLHSAYQFVYERTKQFVQEFKMPITHLEISEGGGVWPFPIEYETRENHPFKYGYGVLLHTGFHFVDLLAHYQSINHTIGLQEDAIDVHAYGATPYDILHQLPQATYEKLFPKESFAEEFASLPLERYKQYGMPDIVSNMQFMKDGAVITQSSLSMLQTSVCARGWRQLDEQAHRGLGRRSQVHVGLFCGPFFYISLGYYKPDYSPKGEDSHYIIEIARNAALVGGKPLERYRLGGKAVVRKEVPTVNRSAKFKIMAEWMQNGVCARTEFSLHKRSVWLMMKLAQELISRKKERFENKIS